MKLEVTFVETLVFGEDVVMHGVDDRDLELLKRNLAKNPLLGDTAPDGHGLRYCRVKEFNVIYKPSDDFSRIFLLRLRPVEEKPSQLPARIGGAILELAMGFLKTRLENWFGKKG